MVTSPDVVSLWNLLPLWFLLHVPLPSPPGVLRTAVPDMDRETRDEYLVVLQAKDMGGHLGGLSGTTTITVKLSDVNDNPPHFRRSKHCCYQITTLLSAAFNLCSCRICVCMRVKIKLMKHLVMAFETAVWYFLPPLGRTSLDRLKIRYKPLK